MLCNLKCLVEKRSYWWWKLPHVGLEGKCWSNAHLPIIFSVFFFLFKIMWFFSHFLEFLVFFLMIFSWQVHCQENKIVPHQVKLRYFPFLAPRSFKLRDKAVRDYIPLWWQSGEFSRSPDFVHAEENRCQLWILESAGILSWCLSERTSTEGGSR